MELALLEHQAELDIETKRVTIDNKPELEQAYGSKVPVLCLGDIEICHYYLDPAALKRAISQS